MRLCAVSVDLDEIPNYSKIHGLAALPPPACHAVYDVAVPRLRAMAKDSQLPLTLFAIGADMVRTEAAAALRAAVVEGHEIANHSLDHRYDLTRLSEHDMRRQIDGGQRAIHDATGVRPTGFRAPGYTTNDAVVSVLRDEGFAYDSSVFPCPLYFAAKTAAIGIIAARGRTSDSVVDTPRVLTAPTRPYRTGHRYFERGDGLLELPIQVTRGLRLPFIGTSLTLGGPTVARALARMCIGEPFVNLELHGIDVLDGADAGGTLEALRPYQVDLRVARDRKLDALHATYDVLRRAGYTFVTLAEAAETFAAKRAS